MSNLNFIAVLFSLSSNSVSDSSKLTFFKYPTKFFPGTYHQFILSISRNLIFLLSDCISDSSKDNWYKTAIEDNADDWIDLRYLPNSIRSNPLSTILHSYAVSIYWTSNLHYLQFSIVTCHQDLECPH